VDKPNNSQLNIFEQIPQPVKDTTPDLNHSMLDAFSSSGLTVGDRIHIIRAGPPFEHMNGQKGEVTELKADAVFVQVEGIAVALMFRREALEKWTAISEYTTAREEAESVVLFRVGDRVECDSAFMGQVGTVRKIGTHCAVTVAWVDYGAGKPLYPSPLEHLSQAE
jgi:hypothetical protein